MEDGAVAAERDREVDGRGGVRGAVSTAAAAALGARAVAAARLGAALQAARRAGVVRLKLGRLGRRDGALDDDAHAVGGQPRAKVAQLGGRGRVGGLFH